MSEGSNQDSKDLSQIDRRKAEQARLDYAAWRDHLAAPGSRFAPDRAEPTRTARIDPVSRQDGAAIPERRAA